MKKRLIFIFACLLVVFSVGFIGILLFKSSTSYCDKISMEIDNDTLTPVSVTIIIKDLNEKKNTFGEEYRIDELVNDEWLEVKRATKDDVFWNMIGYRVDSNNLLKLDINWEWLYGRLDSGKYRLVKAIGGPITNDKYCFYGYFTID